MKRGVVDLSSVIWTCLKSGKDSEHAIPLFDEEGAAILNTKGVQKTCNSAQYGFDNVVAHMKSVMEELRLKPFQLILVQEGKNSKSGRQGLLATYKGGSDKHPVEYEQFLLCRDMVIELFLSLGSNLCWQDNGVEADDVIGYLALHLKGEVWIITNDKDLGQCVGGNVHLYRMGMKDQNPFGPFDFKYIPTYIAVVGDAADKIPGAYLFGVKSMEKLLTAFGEDGLELLEVLIKTHKLDKLAEDVGELKELQRIIDNKADVELSYQLALLWTHKVNTLHGPLQWRAGMVKRREEVVEPAFRKFGGTVTLVCAENYDDVKSHFSRLVASTEFFSLDIETSTPEASDEWLRAQEKTEVGIDVFGSELTGLSITYGANLEHTVYLTHEHIQEEGVTNLTIAQVRDFVDMIPRHKITWVHNNAFELPVLYQEWGQDWITDPLYHGFLRNVRDTSIASSYVDENRRRGLKSLSKDLLRYEQVTYADVTTSDYKATEWSGKGTELARWREPVGTGTYGTVLLATGDFEIGESYLNHHDEVCYHQGAEIMREVQGAEIMDTETGPVMVRVQHKMNELTARRVLNYGADDTICTSALANFFTIIMEIEDTYDTFEEVETFPAYLTALAFVQGVDFSLEEMAVMEKEDDEAYAKAWAKLRDYLMTVGFEGTVCPTVAAVDRAAVKLACDVILGWEFTNLSRLPNKLAKVVEQWGEEQDDESLASRARVLAMLIAKEDTEGVNQFIAQHFDGEPKLDLASPRQMQVLLYDKIGIPIQIVNDVTIKERQFNAPLSDALKKFKQRRMGKSVTMTDEDMRLLRGKAKTDDTAIDYALAFDADSIDDLGKDALAQVGVLKKVMTRRSLYYKNYWKLLHWKDGKIHAFANQCAAVTRRYSMAKPNLQQLPKKGEAVRFRGFFKPHHADAVICSIDFTGQELRLAAEISQDPNMLACYVGDNLKDIHSITAASSMKLKWSVETTLGYLATYGKGLSDTDEGLYKMFLTLRKLGKSDPVGKKADDLRKDSKNVNFLAQFGGQAAKLSETLIMRYSDAQLFLDARAAMFPVVDEAARKAAEFVLKHGYETTMMGARRHLQEVVRNGDKREISGAQRQGWNMKVQGSAGEMTKVGMTRLWKSGVLFRLDCRFIAPIHDELVTSVHMDHAVEFLKIKHECMTGEYADMQVPILGSISLGRDFADQTECGDWFIEENIKKAIYDCFKEPAHG